MTDTASAASPSARQRRSTEGSGFDPHYFIIRDSAGRHVDGKWVRPGQHAGGLALLRLAEQVSIQPQLDLVLSAAGTALFLLYLPLAAGIARAKGGGWSSNLTGAFVLDLALDAAVQTATLTLDLSWHPGLVPTLSVALLSLLLLICIKQQASSLEKVVLTEGSFGRLVPLAAFGPWLLLHLLVFHNLAAVSARSGLETPLAGGLVILTDALALAVLSWQSRKTSGLVLKTLLAGMALVISLALLQVGGLAPALLLAIGSLSSVLLAGTLLTGALLHHAKSGLWRSSTSLGIGQILFVLLTFLYYLTYDIDLGFRSQVLLPLIGLLVAGFGLLSAWQQGSHPAPQADFQPALACLALLLAPLANWQLLQGAPFTPSAQQAEPQRLQHRLVLVRTAQLVHAIVQVQHGRSLRNA